MTIRTNIIASWYANSVASYKPSILSSRSTASINRGGGILSKSSMSDGAATSDGEIRDDASVSRLLSQSLRRRSHALVSAVKSQSLPRNLSVDNLVSHGVDNTEAKLDFLQDRNRDGNGTKLCVDPLATPELGSQAHTVEGHTEEKNTIKYANAVLLSAPENTKVVKTQRSVNAAADKVSLYRQAFAILQPAFDEKILSEAQMRGLIDADDELPFDFVVALLALYKQEQSANLELIREAIYEGDSLTQLKVEVDLSNVRYLLHNMRGGAMNLGDETVTEACSRLRQICSFGDLKALANGPGHWPDLVRASRVSASYFERFLKFVEPNTRAATPPK
eukprot:CAMPEP_0198199478 /NCGR_PEP_ID=MMETSP1445-20131203/2773_1 /TAXON_ID=36898 /ORGANISM="Pyramimonas sp., Strain CCMP2087" /LENGTH=334 /DNA_ID=CAMNT_0043869337 /DNA_START=456 /DNA_END=1460 /DNA_ORIENTATION=-